MIAIRFNLLRMFKRGSKKREAKHCGTFFLVVAALCFQLLSSSPFPQSFIQSEFRFDAMQIYFKLNHCGGRR